MSVGCPGSQEEITSMSDRMARGSQALSEILFDGLLSAFFIGFFTAFDYFIDLFLHFLSNGSK